MLLCFVPTLALIIASKGYEYCGFILPFALYTRHGFILHVRRQKVSEYSGAFSTKAETGNIFSLRYKQVAFLFNNIHVYIESFMNTFIGVSVISRFCW